MVMEVTKNQVRDAWEEYRRRGTERIDLTDIGLPGFWVEVKKPGTYTLEEMDVIAKISESATVRDMKEAYPIIITGWNLTNPKDGKPLRLPKDEKKSLDVLPLDIFLAIGKRIADLMKKEETIPETKGT